MALTTTQAHLSSFQPPLMPRWAINTNTRFVGLSIEVSAEMREKPMLVMGWFDQRLKEFGKMIVTVLEGRVRGGCLLASDPT